MHNGYFVDGKKVHKMSKTGLFVEKEVIDDPVLVELKKAYESLHRHVVYTNSLHPSINLSTLIYDSWEPASDTIAVNTEFYSLLNTSITDCQKAEVSIAMNVKNVIPQNNSLLVFSIMKEEPDTTIVRYWKSIEVKELLQNNGRNDYLLKINHRILNDELNIQAGDRLSVYFWNPQGEAMDYVLSKKKIRVFISKE